MPYFSSTCFVQLRIAFARTFSIEGRRGLGLDDLTNKAKDAVNGEKGEEFSDQGLDKATDFANDKTGGKFEDQINQGRDGVDGKLGNE